MTNPHELTMTVKTIELPIVKKYMETIAAEMQKLQTQNNALLAENRLIYTEWFRRGEKDQPSAPLTQAEVERVKELETENVDLREMVSRLTTINDQLRGRCDEHYERILWLEKIAEAAREILEDDLDREGLVCVLQTIKDALDGLEDA